MAGARTPNEISMAPPSDAALIECRTNAGIDVEPVFLMMNGRALIFDCARADSKADRNDFARVTRGDQRHNLLLLRSEIA